MLFLQKVTRNVRFDSLKSTFHVSLSVVNERVNILAKEVVRFWK